MFFSMKKILDDDSKQTIDIASEDVIEKILNQKTLNLLKTKK